MAAIDEAMSPDDRRRFARLVASAWADSAVRDRYEQDPRAVLAEYGIEWPEGAPTPALPADPGDEIDVESLEITAGGALATIGTVSCMSSPLRDRSAE